MKRYLMFAFNAFYPSGGMNDCVLQTDHDQECKSKLEELRSKRFGYDHVQIIDVVEDTHEHYELWKERSKRAEREKQHEKN